MLAKVNSAAVVGLEGQLVEVEVDISGGLPSTTVVGLPDTAVQSPREGAIGYPKCRVYFPCKADYRQPGPCRSEKGWPGL